MKKIIVFFIASILVTSVHSQDYFKTLTEKYADTEGFSASFITKDMFNMYLKKKQVDEKSTMSETLKNLDNILMVSQSVYGKENNNATKEELHKEILNHYKNDNSFTLFKTQKTIGEDLKVYLKKADEKITSLAVVNASSYSVSLVELNGLIDMENLADLGKELNLRGLESLYRVNNSEVVVMGYPSPRGDISGLGKISGNWMVAPDMKKLEEQMELLEKNKELSAEQRKKIEEQARVWAEKQAQFAEQYREMAEKYKRSPIFLSTPGDTNVVYYLNGKKVSASDIKTINPDDIKTIDVNKSDEKGKKSTIRIITKK